MSKVLTFSNRQNFRGWLDRYASESGGVWLLFGKKGGPTTLSANEALEEALCYGWIDGRMQSLDHTSYKKYFARRSPQSNWSDKNKKLAQSLIEKGLMAEQGMAAIERARKNGAREAPKRMPIADEQIRMFQQIVRPYEPAYTNLLAMPRSVQRTYTGFYLEAKSDRTRQTRLERIVDRLNQNLKPM